VDTPRYSIQWRRRTLCHLFTHPSREKKPRSTTLSRSRLKVKSRHRLIISLARKRRRAVALCSAWSCSRVNSSLMSRRRRTRRNFRQGFIAQRERCRERSLPMSTRRNAPRMRRFQRAMRISIRSQTEANDWNQVTLLKWRVVTWETVRRTNVFGRCSKFSSLRLDETIARLK
jgi:hypothetical protein